MNQLKNMSGSEKNSYSISTWTEKDIIDNQIINSRVFIFITSGCSWFKKHGGCTMCGYNQSIKIITLNKNVPPLKEQIDKAFLLYQNEEMLKIYTSGSFLDEEEISEEDKTYFFKKFKNVKTILIESRPQFINHNTLKNLPPTTIIALGLESSNNNVLTHSINKGFLKEDIVVAVQIIKQFNLKIRTYLIFKPLFLSEKEAIEDTISSINFAKTFSYDISINPTNVQKYTILEKFWKKGEYRTPWIWSLLEVLKNTNGNVRIFSSPSGGGSSRGIHNCGKCDYSILKKIREYSLTQNINNLSHECKCFNLWKKYLCTETLLNTSFNLELKFKGEYINE